MTTVFLCCFFRQASAQQKYDSAVSRAENTASDAAERAQAKLDSYKKSAESTIYGVRDDAKAKMDAKAKEAEGGGSGWFGRGKGK